MNWYSINERVFDLIRFDLLKTENEDKYGNKGFKRRNPKKRFIF